VLERETGLEDYIDTGVRVDAAPSAELLEGIFFPNSPLHDGAVILRENRVVAAACTLPLAEDSRRGQMGTRHRAALGITESTDAVSVVVSEETGEICVASNGRMLHRLDRARLRPTLVSILGGTPSGRG
jgi:diadenylate cyclase